MDTIFNFPAVHTQILFGYGTIKELHQRVKNLGGKKVLLVSDTGVVKAGILDTIHEILERGGISVIRFTEVPQDSSTMVATKGAGLLETERCDMVIGVGGGSSLDSAKAIAVAATNPLPLSQYAGLNKVQNKPLPVIAIPTTAGTGSEVSFWSVMTNEENRVKIGIGGELVFPTLAVCDPDLTLSLPPFFTATTGMDALVHAMESYVNRSYQPISSVFTYRAME